MYALFFGFLIVGCQRVKKSQTGRKEEKQSKAVIKNWIGKLICQS